MKLYYFVWIIYYLKTTDSTVYYSKQPKAYEEAKLACYKTGGRLLRYGQLFNEVVRNCTEKSTSIWTGTPWYLKEFACYNTTGNGVSFPSNNTEVAQCADKCEDKEYLYFATQKTECKCFTDNISPDAVLDNFCNTIECPGNAYEQCGNDKSPDSKLYVLYEKVKDNNESRQKIDNKCIVRTYLTHASDGEEEFKDCSLNHITFICKVGDSDDILCSVDEFNNSTDVPITYGTSTISASETTTLGSNSSETSFSSNISLTTSTKPLVSDQEFDSSAKDSDNGIIIGLVVGVGILLIIMLVMIVILVRFRRNRSASNPGPIDDKVNIKTNNVPLYSAVIPKSERGKSNDTDVKSSSNDQKNIPDNHSHMPSSQPDEDQYVVNPDGVYDSATRHPQKLTDPKTENFGDYSTVNPEGVYDSAARHPQKLTNPKTENFGDYSTVNPEGVYDSAAHQKDKLTHQDIDNIYDHQLDDVYDVSTHKNVQENALIYDQTV